jgi:hypothetical protein
MAFTTIPPAGSKLRGSTLNALIIEVRPLVAVKAVDEPITSSVALQSDDALTLAVEANATYEFTMILRYDATAASDFRTQLSLPTGATAFYVADGVPTAGSAFSLFDAVESTVFVFEGAGAGTVRDVVFRGHIVVSTTAGSATLQWAQGTSGGTATIVKAGSTFVARRLS